MSEFNWIIEGLLRKCPELRFYKSIADMESRKCLAGGIVYFIAFQEIGPVKVGFTTRPKTRFSCIESQAGQKLTQIYLTRPHWNYAAFEGHMHWKLYQSRGIGEWFNLHIDDVIKAFHEHKGFMNTCVRYEEPKLRFA